MPDQKIFESHSVIGDKGAIMQQGAIFHIFERVEYPEEGGILVYYKGLPYPKKGFPYPEALHAVDVMKRLSLVFVNTLAMKEMILPILGLAILPWKMKMRVLERALHEFNRPIEWFMQGHFIKDERHAPSARALKKFARSFLMNLGIREDVARYTARNIATVVEYDDAYRYRLEDVMSETRDRWMISDPKREVQKLIRIFAERETADNVKRTFKSFSRIASIILFIPKVRKALVQAVREAGIQRMAMDEADRYHTLLRGDYNYGGKTMDERREIFKARHPDGIYPPQIQIESTEMP
jgi:hypothetical protein